MQNYRSSECIMGQCHISGFSLINSPKNLKFLTGDTLVFAHMALLLSVLLPLIPHSSFLESSVLCLLLIRISAYFEVLEDQSSEMCSN